MKRFLLGCAIAVSGFAMPQAFAMDNCCPSQCDPCCDEVVDFNGFYLGGNLGAFTHVAHRNDIDGFLAADRTGWTTVDTSFTIGVQGGYDWQCYNKLFGVVVDWNWVDTNRETRGTVNPDVNFSHNNKSDWFTTIRARLGVVVCNDALVYVTGGAVVTRFNTRWNNDLLNDGFNHHRSRWGWTGGFGTEMLVWCNFSIGAEFLFMHFSNHIRTFTSAAGTNFAFGHSDSAWVGRFLINYRFGDLCSWCCN